MQLTELFDFYKSLQKIHGDKKYDPIYGAGCTKNPELFLVFMNPTARNVSSEKNWKGIKAPWIGTKSTWKLLYSLNRISENIFKRTQEKKPEDWNEDFSLEVYNSIKENKTYITNLSKATQIDARPLPDSLFKEYLAFIKKEVSLVHPKIIITFGNQVSSIFLDENVSVSKHRKKFKEITIENNLYKVFPVYYPVGQGMRNIDKAEEDINWIQKHFL